MNDDLWATIGVIAALIACFSLLAVAAGVWQMIDYLTH